MNIQGRDRYMLNTWYIWLVVLAWIFLLYLLRKRRRKSAAIRHVKYRKNSEQRRKDIAIMKELLSRFMEYDVYIKLLDGHADGVVKEVSDNGVVLENKDGLQIVNLEYVLKVREYPYKNGKRVLILDEYLSRYLLICEL